MRLLCLLLLVYAECKRFKSALEYQERVNRVKKGFPVVFWHGMGDHATSSGMNQLINAIKDEYPGIYVKSLSYGSTIMDIISGYSPGANTLVSWALKEIETDENLKQGYVGIGLSQGAQLLRAVAQRHSRPTMKKLISIGGQHQGVFGLPMCPPTTKFCLNLASYISKILCAESLQNWSVQAGYWHDPFQQSLYKEKSLFLADINQEREINENYRRNIKNLTLFAMYKFNKDSLVYPNESSNFGFYADSDLTKILSLSETELYKEDRLGLRYLNENNKLKLGELDAEHLKFSYKWFEKNIVPFVSINEN